MRENICNVCLGEKADIVKEQMIFQSRKKRLEILGKNEQRFKVTLQKTRYKNGPSSYEKGHLTHR